MSKSLQRALRGVETEIASLVRERDTIDQTIGRLRKVAAALRGSTAAPTNSLTSGCRAVLRTFGPGATPREVRDALSANAFDWSAYTNPMSAVHTVLKRLVRQGEASVGTGADGMRRYEWKPPDRVSARRSQAAEADRIEHLLDGAVSTGDFITMLNRWTAARASGSISTHLHRRKPPHRR